jgi:glycosyltransferase involved in cell wall biosynthesis
MIKAAFYAPLKSPNSPVPSGDRAVARALRAAMANGGIATDLASELQTRDGFGDAKAQAQLVAQAEQEVHRLLKVGRDAGWAFWLTYHNYYKAPDLIGPEVSQALGIPYVLVEATRARKRLTGPWADFAARAERATDHAALVFYFTEHDEEALRTYGSPSQKLMHLRPFLPEHALPPETTRRDGLLSVGMFRKGDKLASYQLIADTLRLVKTPQWNLRIAGDGPERAQVQATMAPFGARVQLLGQQSASELEALYARASILFWPGVNEAFGMTYLEAQAAGLTVLAQDRPGVRDVLTPCAAYPVPESGAAAMAARLDMLLNSPKMVMKLGQSARRFVESRHLMTSAGRTLRAAIDEVLA